MVCDWYCLVIPVAGLIMFSVFFSRCSWLIYGLWLTFPGHSCCLAVIVLCLFLAMPWVDLRSLTDIFCHSRCLANSVQCLFLTMQLVDLWSVTNIFCVFSSWCRGMIYGLWLTFPGHSCCLAVSVLCLFTTMPWFTYGLWLWRSLVICFWQITRLTKVRYLKSVKDNEKYTAFYYFVISF